MAAKKKKATTKVKEEDVYYVGISDPINLRRSILESSKVAIQFLKSYEMLKGIRTEKAELMIEFENEMKALNRLMTKLKSELPKTKFKEAIAKATPVHHEKKVISKNQALDHIKGKPVKAKAPKKHNELDKLEAELSDIESKMQSLR